MLGICEICGQSAKLKSYLDMELCDVCWDAADDIYRDGESLLQSLTQSADSEWDEFYQKFYLDNQEKGEK